MSTLYEIFIGPFSEFEFMQRALAGVLALALGACPIGVSSPAPQWGSCCRVSTSSP